MRKEQGLDISDRVQVTWSADAELADAVRAHAEGIAEEVLATSFVEGEVGDLPTDVTVDGMSARVLLGRA
jgi:isoleucyl-tRNA synthetase